MYTWHPKICDLAYANKTNKLHSFFPPFFIFFRGEQKRTRRRWGTWHQRRWECQIYKTLTFKFVKVQKNKTSSHKWKQKLRDQGRWKSRIQTGVRLHWHQALFFLRVLVLLLKLKIITKLNENSECTHLVYIDFMLQKPPVHMTETFLVQYSLSHSRFLLGKNQTENSVIWLMIWIMFLKPLWFYWMTCGGEELMRAFPLL